MESLIQKAGPFDVAHIPCRAYAGPANLSAPRSGVIHTTESNFDSALAEFRGKFAPHFLISGSTIAQLLPIGVSGASLVTHNNAALVQIEVVAYSKQDPWFPDDSTAQRLAAVMATCHHLFGIPLSRPWADGDWGRYGDNPHRHATFWGRVAGWYGHGDVPSPDQHWDPGNLQWGKLFSLAHGLEQQLEDPGEPTGHEHTPPDVPPTPTVNQLNTRAWPWPPLAVGDAGGLEHAFSRLGYASGMLIANIGLFQHNNGLAVDGVAGPLTVAAINEALKRTAP